MRKKKNDDFKFALVALFLLLIAVFWMILPSGDAFQKIRYKTDLGYVVCYPIIKNLKGTVEYNCTFER